jgi:hypothetical protein
MSTTPLFGHLPRRYSVLELFGEEFSNTIFRIIKWTPRPRASYETGVTALFHEFQVQGRIPPGNISDFV